MTLPPGTRIGGYEILGLIGAGGMGQVYRARDEKLKRLVAIKILPPELSGDTERLKRFRREALSLAALNHPNIAHIHGLEETTLGDGSRVEALVMELVDGDTLAPRVARGGMRWAALAPIASQLVDALDASHTAGIVHRDLKPSNICVAADGSIKVIDFGVAMPLAATADTGTRTASLDEARIVGTVRYMSPEQARGGAVDKRTDIWAFGCILYELITGKAAFPGATWTDAVVAIVEKDPDWAAISGEVPPQTIALIRHCLVKDPRGRLRDIGDARGYLAAVPTPATAGAPVAWWSSVPWVIATVLAVLLIGTTRRTDPASDEPQGPEFGRVTRLTSGPAVELGPAISPDGQWVAFLSNAGGDSNLMVRYIAGGDTVNLTALSGLQLPTRIDIGGPAISPDGTLIAFDAGAKPGTPSNLFDSWVLPAPLGGLPRKLVERGRALRWSPDGARIAYIRAGAAAGDAIYVANADGSNEQIVMPARGGMHAHWLQWAHDASALYFTYSISTANSEPTEIYQVRLSDGEISPVVQTARRAAFPFAMPDGNGMIYSANPETFELGLWWRGANGLTKPVTTGVGEYAEPSLSRDGQRLVATLVDWEQSLVTLTIGDRSTPPVGLLDLSLGDLDPTVSPDGTRAVFSSTRTGSRTLWRLTLANKEIRPLTSGNVLDERPSFSPDGQRIAFVSDRGGARGVWVISADGGAPRRVVNAAPLDMLSWSPDGSKLVYSASAGPTPGLYMVNVADGATRRLETPGPASSPVWCPQRDVIAYIEAKAAAPDTPNSSRVAAVTSRGAAVDLKYAMSPNVLNGFLACSADGGTLVAFVDPGAGSGAIWVADLDRALPFRRVYEAPVHVRFRGAAWLPRSSSMIVGQSKRSADIVLMERVR